MVIWVILVRISSNKKPYMLINCPFYWGRIMWHKADLRLIQTRLPVTADIIAVTSNSHFNRVFGRDSQSNWHLPHMANANQNEILCQTKMRKFNIWEQGANNVLPCKMRILAKSVAELVAFAPSKPLGYRRSLMSDFRTFKANHQLIMHTHI